MPPPTRIRKTRARAYSYRHKNAIKVSVKRGDEELEGRERRVRINELLWFLPSQNLNALSPKQLETLFQAHQCSICEKVFRLVSGVQIHVKNEHEKRTLLGYFKKTKKDNNNNSKAARKLTTAGSVPQSPHVSSVKSSFKCKKTPTYRTKPALMSPKTFRKKIERSQNNNNTTITSESQTLDKFTALSVSDNSSKTAPKHDGASVKKLENNGASVENPENIGASPEKPKPVSSERQSPCLSSGKQSSMENFFKCRKTPTYRTKPLLMTPKTYRKRFPTTPEDGNHIASSKTARKSLETMATQIIQPSCKPKLMTQKKWLKKLAMTQQNNNKDGTGAKSAEEHAMMPAPIRENMVDNVENDPDVIEFFEFVKSQPVLLD